MPKQGFISWSGEEARTLAERLQQFLRHVLANPTLFVASKDIAPGASWFSVISEQLDLCDVGVIIVTPQNKERPWLHFEAGAIAKRVGSGAAIPLLCGVAKGELSGTALAQLQALDMNAEDLRKLCGRLNDLLGQGLEPSHIDEAFEMWWAKFESLLVDPSLWGTVAPTTKEPTIADVSVQLNQINTAISQIADRLKKHPELALGIHGQGQLATMNLADLQHIIDGAKPSMLARPITVQDLRPDDDWTARLKALTDAAVAARLDVPPAKSTPKDGAS